VERRLPSFANGPVHAILLPTHQPLVLEMVVFLNLSQLSVPQLVELIPLPTLTRLLITLRVLGTRLLARINSPCAAQSAALPVLPTIAPLVRAAAMPSL
jgi:hypothetical protein